jgi:hypothetical protein
MVESALPKLDPAILNTPEGQNWLKDLSIQQVANAVQDLPVPQKIHQNHRRFEARDKADTKVIKFDEDQGRVRYLSKPRSFDWSRSPHKAIPKDDAKILALKSLEELGIPSKEWGGIQIDTVMGQYFDPSVGNKPEPPFERERLVTVSRRMNDYNVFENYGRIAISNEGKISRLLAIWPQFKMARNLELRLRSEIVDTAAKYIFDAEKGAAVETEIDLVYVRAGYCFIPVAIVSFGDELTTGVEVAIPIVDVPPDKDYDGVEDKKDNCGEKSNPDQLDRDKDGVGDQCDNCPDKINPKQVDSNGDRVGDACDMGEKKDGDEEDNNPPAKRETLGS